MQTTQIRETWQRVILLPAGTTYTDAYVAVSGRQERVVVLGLDQQYSLFYELCDLAALCEGGDLLVCGAKIKPEQYLRQWRQQFKDARLITDSRNSDLLVTATLVVDPAKLAAEDSRYRIEQFDELRAAHPFLERDGRFEFSFDLANPAEAKVLYDKKRLHFDEAGSPISVSMRAPTLAQAAQPELWELLA